MLDKSYTVFYCTGMSWIENMWNAVGEGNVPAIKSMVHEPQVRRLRRWYNDLDAVGSTRVFDGVKKWPFVHDPILAAKRAGNFTLGFAEVALAAPWAHFATFRSLRERQRR